MKRYIIAIIIIAIGVGAYNYSQNVHDVVQPIIKTIQKRIFPADPCTEPILYSIKKFDDRFGISESQFKRDIAAAANIWNAALNKTLFIYDDSGELEINLIYDYRQRATVQLNKIDDVISDNRASYDALKAKYDALSIQYTQEKASLQMKINSYGQKLASYNERVAYWNDRGGAPRNEYEKLQSEKQSLNADMALLDQERSAFNELVNSLNSLTPELNRLVKILNLNVKAYNTVGASTGEQFSEGEYTEDVSGTRISIYQFKNEAQLIRVLEHELGHALGLGHVEDPKAIMYYLNQGTNEKLTNADISELNMVCSKK